MENKPPVPAWKQYNRTWYEKLWLSICSYIKNVWFMISGVIKSIPQKLKAFFISVGCGFRDLWSRFKTGDWRTRMSYLVMGFGCFSRGSAQFLKGFALFAIEILYFLYMIFLDGFYYLSMFGSLGEVGEHFDENSRLVPGDNSIQIFLFGILTIIITMFFLYMWVKNTEIAYKTQKDVEAGKPLSNARQQINYALNDGYHVTILALPIFGIMMITVLPLVCNILVAFTNFNYETMPPKLFEWSGFDAFGIAFGQSYGAVIWSVLAWTLVWAFFATFTNFFFGMFLAMMINKKSIKLKMFWRTCFVLVIAIPDFVSLMLMSKFFSYNPSATFTGAVNQILTSWFGVNTGDAGGINFFGASPSLARTMVIVINMWRGMPYTMLATSGILMNIPEELYESSKIDGAGPVRRFISITFPYIMFVMGPQLITTFTGNINNFNVIFFLTGGGPTSNVDGVIVGKTDLLITWLYKLTVNTQEPKYNLGAVIGIFTFVITAFFALIVFNSSKSNTQEDTFQ